MSKVDTEVLVIGGGVVGTAIARELSRYKVDAALVEKNDDFGQGITKASSSLVCQGGNTLVYQKGTGITEDVWESYNLIENTCLQLDIPFVRRGDLSVFRNNKEKSIYEERKRRADLWGINDGMPKIKQEWVDTETLREWEPNLNREFIGALYDPSMAVIDQVRLSIAQAANAKKNGVNVMVDSGVLDISRDSDGFTVKTTKDTIRCRFIVNAAGEYAKEIAQKVDADDFITLPMRVYQGVVDKRHGPLISHNIIALVNGAPFCYVVRTVHDNIFFGIAENMEKEHYHATKKNQIDISHGYLKTMLPDVPLKDIIHSFAGYHMYKDTENGMIESNVAPSKWVPRFIHAQIGFPGVNNSPGIARKIVRFLLQQGLNLEDDPNFDPYEKAQPVFSELSDEEKIKLIEQDPRYGHVICRCETVTEGEIVEAIRRGARTIDGVKFRCRPGMGRCHGGFCSPRVLKILARELNIPEEEITFKGGQSRHLVCKSKDLLRR